jgi:hypothetical protein
MYLEACSHDTATTVISYSDLQEHVRCCVIRQSNWLPAGSLARLVKQPGRSSWNAAAAAANTLNSHRYICTAVATLACPTVQAGVLVVPHCVVDQFHNVERLCQQAGALVQADSAFDIL